MPKIKLYIATTLDGYIARQNGSLDWLDELEVPEGVDFGYSAFYETIDCILMGRSTYEEVLGFDVDWPYDGCKTIIYSSHTDFKTPTPDTSLATDVTPEEIERLKSVSEKNIWLVGGGKLIREFLEHDAVDEMIITIIPRMIGNGIRLFPESEIDQKFKLTDSKTFPTGVVNLHYERV